MRSKALSLLWYWGPLIAYGALIYHLSAISQPPFPFWKLPSADKLLHFVEYAGLGALLCRALELGGEGLSARLALLSAIFLGALYGLTDELHQAFVPGRAPDLVDFGADAAGAALGAVVYRLLRPSRKPVVRGGDT